MQTHDGIGRTLQQRENAAARPYLMWDAINDSRTRDSHRAMDGHVAPIGDPIWQRWNAPAGHRCRCTRVALTEAQARARGWPKGAPAVEPDKGWEGDPTEGNADLISIVRERQASCATTFAAKKARARALWCDQAEAGALLQQALSSAENAGMRQPQGLFTPYDITEPRGMPDVSTPARAAAVAFENVVRLEAIEHGAAFAADGSLILRKAGQPDRLGYTDAELERMRGAVFTHNHPNGVTVSVADLSLAARLALTELRAVGPQFRHIMAPQADWPSGAELARAVSQARREAQQVVQTLIFERGLSARHADAEMTHQVMVAVARKFRLTYRREYT